MIPNTQAELDAVRDECYAVVTARAALSAVTSAIPAPGVDVAADAAILLELIPVVNNRFGLSRDQIEGYDPIVKQTIYQVIKRAGLALVGVEATKTVVTQALKKIAGRAVTRQILKFIPIAGSVANATIGFAAMKYVGNSHVDDCYAVCKRLLNADAAQA